MYPLVVDELQLLLVGERYVPRESENADPSGIPIWSNDTVVIMYRIV